MNAEEFPDFSPTRDIILSEQAVVGAAMMSRAAAEALAGIVTPGQFRKPAHGLIFGATLALADRGDPVDPVAVLAELTRSDDLRAAGSGPYVHECYAAGAVPDAAWHAQRVEADYRRRHAAEGITRALSLVTSPTFDHGTGFDQVWQIMSDALAPPRDAGLRSMADLMTHVVGDLEQETERGLPTGLADLDRVVNGLAPGQLVLVAARPGVGKSILTTGIAAHAAMKSGLPVLLSSLEMSAEEITLRLISSRARVPLTSLLDHSVDDGGWAKINRVFSEIADSPLVIDDTPECTLAHIRSRLRSMARTAPARLLVVDYLGLLAGPKVENRQVEVAALSRGLKLIAREFTIPVVAAAQLNRGPEHRQDKRPALSDLRDSGAQEQDADVVILLHREDAYNRESPRAGEIDLDVAKNRQGPRAMVTAAFQGHYARCVGMAPDDAEGAWAPSLKAVQS